MGVIFCRVRKRITSLKAAHSFCDIFSNVPEDSWLGIYCILGIDSLTDNFLEAEPRAFLQLGEGQTQWLSLSQSLASKLNGYKLTSTNCKLTVYSRCLWWGKWKYGSIFHSLDDAGSTPLSTLGRKLTCLLLKRKQRSPQGTYCSEFGSPAEIRRWELLLSGDVVRHLSRAPWQCRGHINI